jgi:hypothetical protein
MGSSVGFRIQDLGTAVKFVLSIARLVDVNIAAIVGGQLQFGVARGSPYVMEHIAAG